MVISIIVIEFKSFGRFGQLGLSWKLLKLFDRILSSSSTTIGLDSSPNTELFLHLFDLFLNSSICLTVNLLIITLIGLHDRNNNWDFKSRAENIITILVSVLIEYQISLVTLY